MSKLSEQIKQALEAATPGPWERTNACDVFTLSGAKNREGIEADHNDGWMIADTAVGVTKVKGEEHELKRSESAANAHLIANAPTWLSQLLAEREQMVWAFKLILSEDTWHKWLDSEPSPIGYAEVLEDIARITLQQVGELE